MLPFFNVLLRSLRPPLVRVLSFHNLDFVIIFTESHIGLFTIFHLMHLLSLMVSRTITFFFSITAVRNTLGPSEPSRDCYVKDGLGQRLFLEPDHIEELKGSKFPTHPTLPMTSALIQECEREKCSTINRDV